VGQKKLLTVGMGLLGKDFEFMMDIILVVDDPVLYMGFQFGYEFFESVVVNAVMSMVG